MWYLKKPDNSIYGPVETPVLKRWAEEGRIAPEDQLSENKETWSPPGDIAELDMDWVVELPDGSSYGPLHVLALRQPLRQGEINPDSKLQHAATGEQTTVNAVLLDAVLDHNERLQQQILTADAAGTRQTKQTEPVQPSDVTGGESDTTPDQRKWKQTLQEKDTLERELTKWKRMYEEERQDAQKREDEFKARFREIREEEVTTRRRVEKLEHQLHKTEESYDRLKQVAEADDREGAHTAELANLMETYNDLALNYDNLLEQLSEKSGDLKQALDARASIQQDAEQRLRHMQEMLHREQEEADKARRRLADMEETHQQLLRSYRDMNDRFIRMRETQRKTGNAGKKPAKMDVNIPR